MFYMHFHGHFSHRALDLRNIPHLVTVQMHEKYEEIVLTPQLKEPINTTNIYINRKNSVSTENMCDGRAVGNMSQE